MTGHDVERIARTVLRELGAGEVMVVVSPLNTADRWEITITGPQPRSLRIRAGEGTTAQFVREQIFEQLERR